MTWATRSFVVVEVTAKICRVSVAVMTLDLPVGSQVIQLALSDRQA
jgi:hypothetical protein